MGVAMCYYKVNFDSGLEYLGLVIVAEVDGQRS